MHARPAATLVRVANGFPCDVLVERDGRRANAKSVMSLLTLAASCGTRLRVICDGEGAPEALAAVTNLFHRGFDELDGEQA